MKIIKPGVEPDKWWTNDDVTCKACGCVFRIEEDDYASEDMIIHEPGKPPYVGAVTVDCPTCGRGVDVFHPRQHK